MIFFVVLSCSWQSAWADASFADKSDIVIRAEATDMPAVTAEERAAMENIKRLLAQESYQDFKWEEACNEDDCTLTITQR